MGNTDPSTSGVDMSIQAASAASNALQHPPCSVTSIRACQIHTWSTDADPNHQALWARLVAPPWLRCHRCCSPGAQGPAPPQDLGYLERSVCRPMGEHAGSWSPPCEPAGEGPGHKRASQKRIRPGRREARRARTSTIIGHGNQRPTKS